MKAQNSKLRLILTSFAAALMAALLVLDFYHIRSKNAETLRLVELANAKESEEILAKSIKEIQNNSRAELSAFEQIVLSDSEIVPIIENIEKAGRALGLITEITSVEKINDADPALPQRIRIIVESDGSWRGIFALLKAIESLPNRVLLEETTLAK